MIRLGFCMAMMLALVSGASAQSHCMPISSMKHPKEWRTLNHDQWVAMRALYGIIPPVGLPPGNKAMMRKNEDGSALLVFVDGAVACAPMPLPPDVIDLIEQIGKGKIVHVGEAM